MKATFIVGALLALFALAHCEDDVSFGEDTTEAAPEGSGDADVTEVNLAAGRAASRQVNCNCQCSSITFLDKYGQINGNCRTADNSGALWCYVDPRYSQCADLRRSTRTSSLWSYQACATPDIYSAQCGGGYLPSNGNGFGSGFNAASYPNLASGPEGFPFNQNGGYPGLNAAGYPAAGSGGSYPDGLPTGASGYPAGSNSYPAGSNSYPAGSNSYPAGSNSYPNLVDLLGGVNGPRKTEGGDTIIFSN